MTGVVPPLGSWLANSPELAPSGTVPQAGALDGGVAGPPLCAANQTRRGGHCQRLAQVCHAAGQLS